MVLSISCKGNTANFQDRCHRSATPQREPGHRARQPDANMRPGPKPHCRWSRASYPLFWVPRGPRSIANTAGTPREALAADATRRVQYDIKLAAQLNQLGIESACHRVAETSELSANRRLRVTGCYFGSIYSNLPHGAVRRRAVVGGHRVGDPGLARIRVGRFAST